MRQTLNSHRILVVDDEMTVRETIRMLLKVDGHQVKAVSSGAEALEELGNQNYDFVFTDQIMEGMSGEQLAHAIKAKDPFQIVVMFTAYAEVLDQQTQEFLPVDFTLRKPIDIPLLRNILQCLTSEKPIYHSQEKAGHSLAAF